MFPSWIENLLLVCSKYCLLHWSGFSSLRCNILIRHHFPVYKGHTQMEYPFVYIPGLWSTPFSLYYTTKGRIQEWSRCFRLQGKVEEHRASENVAPVVIGPVFLQGPNSFLICRSLIFPCKVIILAAPKSSCDRWPIFPIEQMSNAVQTSPERLFTQEMVASDLSFIAFVIYGIYQGFWLCFNFYKFL